VRFSPRTGPDTRTDAGTTTVRTHRDFRALLGRIEPGDLAVIDRRDLDAASARALVERKPYAVLNAAEFVSGRFANLGPEVLANAGIVLLEAEPDRVRALKDGSVLRVEDSTVYDGDLVVLEAHRLTAEEIRDRMDRARSGMASQLDTFAHTASEFVRREQGVLLHGTGLPTLRTGLEGRSVVVVGPHATAAEVRRLARFVREQKPVLIGVDGGAELLQRGRRRADILVISAHGSPSDRVMRRAREVVLHGAPDAVRRQADKLNLPLHTVASGASSTDIALLLAHAGGARLVIPVGDPGTLEALIDRERSDQASTVLTRLRLGNTLVGSSVVPLLYTGRVRMWHLLLVLLAAVAVLVFTIAATPIGNDGWHHFLDRLPGWLSGPLGGGS
jgi:uncharacterized membrane-anchored protein